MLSFAISNTWKAKFTNSLSSFCGYEVGIYVPVYYCTLEEETYACFPAVENNLTVLYAETASTRGFERRIYVNRCAQNSFADFHIPYVFDATHARLFLQICTARLKETFMPPHKSTSCHVRACLYAKGPAIILYSEMFCAIQWSGLRT